jgi:hypothetical protein
MYYKKNNNKRNVVITTIFIVLILCSTSIFFPTIIGSNSMEIINDHKENTQKMINDLFNVGIEENRKDSVRLKDIVSSYYTKFSGDKKSNIGLSNLYDMYNFFEERYDLQYFELPVSLFDMILNSKNPTVDHQYFFNLYFQQILPLFRAIYLNMASDHKIINYSSNIMNLINSMKEDFEPAIDFKEYERLYEFTNPNLLNDDFEAYKQAYDGCDESWHHSKGWVFYRIFGISEDTFYDWIDRLQAFATGVFWVSLFLTLISFFVISLGGNEVDVFGWLLIAGITVYNALLVTYVFNGYEYFTICKNMEPNIVIHVVDEHGNGINGLEHYVVAKNNNAIDICSEYGPGSQTVWKEIYFTYELGTSSYTNDLNQEEGWYSLSMRLFNDHINEKAPCPPGDWTLTVGGTSSWKKRSMDINSVGSRETVVIDDFVLESTS